MTSKKILVIGAIGETGIRPVEQLVSGGHIADGTYRKPEQAEALRSIRARPVYCNLANITVDLLAEAIAGIDAVVFTAGANQGGDEMTSLIDGQGIATASAAASLAGVSRFLRDELPVQLPTD